MISIFPPPEFVSLSVLVITYSIMRTYLVFIILVLCIEKSFQVLLALKIQSHNKLFQLPVDANDEDEDIDYRFWHLIMNKVMKSDNLGRSVPATASRFSLYYTGFAIFRSWHDVTRLTMTRLATIKKPAMIGALRCTSTIKDVNIKSV